MAIETVQYQSATPATPPATQKVAVDTATEGDIQLVKLAVSADGSALLLPIEAVRGMLVYNAETNSLLEKMLTELRIMTQQLQTILSGRTGSPPSRTGDYDTDDHESLAT